MTKRGITLLIGLLAVQQCVTLPSFAQPYPPSQVVDSMTLDWSTHRRSAQGSDNFQLTWADNDHLYGAWGDGGGFGGTNARGRVGLGIARIEGDADSYRGFNVWGGHQAEHPATFDGKSWGMICVDSALHMWLVPDKPDGKSYRNHYEYIELATSRDHGATWIKADWRLTQADKLTIPTFLNFGKNNAGVPPQFGDYVYSYFIHPTTVDMEHQGEDGVGLIVHEPGILYLARIATDELFGKKNDFQFFCGLGSDDQPMWGTMKQKRPVFQDPNGVGWCLSACYHPHLRRVLLCTEHGKSQMGQLGFFDAPTPWGPWTTIKYYTQSSPFRPNPTASDLPWRDNVFFAAFATKWFDGEAFTLNFTGAGRGKDNDSFNTVKGAFKLRSSH